MIGIVGAGTMGAGIALVCAKAGFRVTLQDRSREMLEKASSYFSKTLARDVEKRRLTEGEREKILRSLRLTEDNKDFERCEIVIEAVPEQLALKQHIFAELSQICSSETLLLSNTSSISITAIAAAATHPERVLGLHFFNPAPVMPLVEVVRGKRTTEENLARVVRFAEELGKTAVVVEDTPGFLVNRIARPFHNESLRILGDHIATIEQIDKILCKAGGFKMGPFALQDLIGIDINYATTESVYQDFFYEKRFQPSRIQQRMVQAGTIGRKAGEGFYEYE